MKKICIIINCISLVGLAVCASVFFIKTDKLNNVQIWKAFQSRNSWMIENEKEINFGYTSNGLSILQFGGVGGFGNVANTGFNTSITNSGKGNNGQTEAGFGENGINSKVRIVE